MSYGTNLSVTANLSRINTLALGAQLPTMHASSEFVRAGGFMSYGPNFPDLYRRAAEFVDKILRGAKPSTSRSSSRLQRPPFSWAFHGGNQNSPQFLPHLSQRPTASAREGFARYLGAASSPF
jgi:hypothetical protein